MTSDQAIAEIMDLIIRRIEKSKALSYDELYSDFKNIIGRKTFDLILATLEAGDVIKQTCYYSMIKHEVTK